MTTKKIGEKLDNLENLIAGMKNDSGSTTLKKSVLQIGSLIIKLIITIMGLVKLIHSLF